MFRFAQKMEYFYTESDKINKPMLALSFVLILVLSFFLGFLYLAATLFMPVYINPLLTIGLGVVLGMFNSAIFRVTRNRSRHSRVAIAIASGIFALFFQWNATLCFAFTGQLPSFGMYVETLNWINLPVEYFQSVAIINEAGWYVGKIPFNGWILTLTWIVEALIILITPLIFALKHQAYPFSEKSGRWYPKYTLLRDFESVPVSRRLLNSLKSDVSAAISSLEKGTAFRHTKIHLYYLKEEDWQYLTFEKVSEGASGVGGAKKQVIISNFKIDTPTAEKLMTDYHVKKEKNDIL